MDYRQSLKLSALRLSHGQFPDSVNILKAGRQRTLQNLLAFGGHRRKVRGMSASKKQSVMIGKNASRKLHHLKFPGAEERHFGAIFFYFLLLMCLAGVPAVRGGDAAKTSIQTYEGILKTGIVKFGDETTGVTLTTKADGIYELDLKTTELKKLTEDLNGQKVLVTGVYKPKAGTEVGERRILEVKTLSVAH